MNSSKLTILDIPFHCVGFLCLIHLIFPILFWNSFEKFVKIWFELPSADRLQHEKSKYLLSGYYNKLESLVITTVCGDIVENFTDTDVRFRLGFTASQKMYAPIILVLIVNFSFKVVWINQIFGSHYFWTILDIWEVHCISVFAHSQYLKDYTS